MIKHNLIKTPLCQYKGCDKFSRWNEKLVEFDHGCDKLHNQRLTSIKNFGTEHPNQNKKQVQQMKKTIMEQYGVTSSLLVSATKEKTKKTNLERYGTEEAGASQIVRDRAKATNLERRGVEESFASKEVQEKSRQTNLEKRGVKYSLACPKVRAKGNKTNLEKYGNIYPMRNEELLERRRQTVIDRYDAYGVQGVPEIALKSIKTHWKKYYAKLLNSKLVKPLFTLDEYNGTRIGTKGLKYNWECKVCETKFEGCLGFGQFALRCPTCFPKNIRVSNAETMLFESINIENKIQTNRNLIEKYEIDIYIPDHNIGIEYNGVYWHSEQTGIDKYYHLNKTLLSENEGIFLIHVFETEWVNRGIQTISMIERHLGIFDEVIPINELTTREITEDETNIFIEENTLDWSNSSFEKRSGVFYINNLVALMTTKRFKDKIVVTKFHEKMGIGFDGNVFELLLNNFELGLPVYYYPDRRHHSFKNKMLNKTGFTFEGGTEPDLWYSENRDTKLMISASCIGKHNISEYVNYDETFTLHENMVLGGYLSIWDCGTLVFRLTKKL